MAAFVVKLAFPANMHCESVAVDETLCSYHIIRSFKYLLSHHGMICQLGLQSVSSAAICQLNVAAICRLSCNVSAQLALVKAAVSSVVSC